MVNTGSEFTFTLSANAGYKVKALTIGDATYSDVTDNTITKKIKIEKNTAVSATLEAEASPTPETGIFTDTQGNKVTIAPVDIYGGEIIGYRLTGDIYIEEINSAAFKAKLNTLNGKDLYTDSLNINCFTNQNSTITAKEITPELLTGVLTIGEERKFSAFRLNNKTADNSPIDIPFKSDTTNYFDITNLAQFSFNENFKLTNDSKILLRAEREPDLHGTEDHTKYAKTTELLSLVNNPKIKHKITVGKVQLRGNVKDLLPLLVGSNKIKEEDGGIIFGKAYDTPCTGENWTGYNGIINDNGNINNTERGILPADQFLELKKRSGDKQSYIRNAIITGLDSKNMTPEQLENAQFYHDILTNVNFKNSDLSKIQMEAIFAGTGKLEFENTILPPAILNSSIGTLILKNATLPEELKTASLRSMINRVPTITNSLKIYNLKNKFFDKWKEEDMQQLTPYKTAPEKYTGPKDVWDKLKFLYRGTEQTETQFTDADLTGSIPKQQSQLLALLQTQNKSRG